MADDKAMVCPFCGWTNTGGEYDMLLHMETLHAEGESSFVVRGDDAPNHNNADTASDAADDVQYADCPVEGCGELVALQELEYHIELHAEETGQTVRESCAPAAPPHPVPVQQGSARPPSGPSRAHRESERHRQADQVSVGKEERKAKSISAWRRLLKMPAASSAQKILQVKRSRDGKHTPSPWSLRGIRLGKAQLGKYAHEERMPDWLVTMLRKHGQVTAQGIIPVLAQLLEQSSTTKCAYLCHPCVQHVSKLRREGGFCGYRNIQMMSSYIIHAQLPGHGHFKGTLPSIFQIQEDIETAWDRGINAQGRVETGGIRGTRKYIGTPEALAVLHMLGVPCEPIAIKHKEAGVSEAQLLDVVENYFQSGVDDPTERVRRTALPPIYFQHPGHSLTIVGFEKLKNGSRQLLVFDPSFHDSSYIVRLVGKSGFTHPMPDLALRPYRRGNKYLKTYREFELLRLRTELG